MISIKSCKSMIMLFVMKKPNKTNEKVFEFEISTNTSNLKPRFKINFTIFFLCKIPTFCKQLVLEKLKKVPISINNKSDCLRLDPSAANGPEI